MKQHNLKGEPRPYLIEYSERLREIYINRKKKKTDIRSAAGGRPYRRGPCPLPIFKGTIAAE